MLFRSVQVVEGAGLQPVASVSSVQSHTLAVKGPLPTSTLAVESAHVERGTVEPAEPFSGLAYGQAVVITATPREGYVFAGWSGVNVVATDPSAATTLCFATGDGTLTANFIPETELLLTTSVVPADSGAVVAEPQKLHYALGESVTLRAVPADGWKFASWLTLPEGAVVTGDEATFVFSAPHHTASAVFVALSSGQVVGWGSNTYGRIGDGTTIHRISPVRAVGSGGEGFLLDVAALASGVSHSLALKHDGTVWAWGRNTFGRLGDGTATDCHTPLQVKGPGGSGWLRDVVAIAAGEYSLALKSDGTVWSWGDGTATPVQIKGPGGAGFLTNIIAIAASSLHSVALRSDGTVWAWGNNSWGQLGDGSTSNKATPVQVKGAGGEGWLTDVAAIAGGYGFTLAVKTDGTVWAWGNNVYGQLGDGTTTSRYTPVQVKGPQGSDWLGGVRAVTAGMYNSAALKSDGTVWSWGRNSYGSLGDGTLVNQLVPVQVKGPGGAGLLEGVVSISAGIDYYMAALTADGCVWTWGYNSLGHLGDGTIMNRQTAAQVRGLDGTDGLRSIAAISAGASHTLAVAGPLPTTVLTVQIGRAHV